MSIFRVALSEDLEKLEGLLKDEGNINARNRAGETVLDVALSRKKKKAAALIKQYGGLSHIELAQKLGADPRGRSQHGKVARAQLVPTVRMALARANVRLRLLPFLP
mgnify:CR=1 FL=1